MTTTSAPLSSRRSSSRSTSPSLSDLTSLATLAELAASQHVSGSDSNPGSCNSSPMSSPKSSSRRALSPTEANAHPHLHIVGDGGGFVFGGTNGSGNNSGSGSGNGRGRGSSNLLEPLSTQLYSPPLSPSSPTASSSSTFQNHFSAILPAVSNTPPNICGDGSHQAPPTLPPIHTMVQPASFHPYQQQQQQQQQQQSYTSMFCTPSSSVLSSSQNNPDAMSPTSIFSESSIARSPPTPSIYNPISSFPPL
ncbi:hypothetical protein BCR41DRAFT_347074 [Lobosporangium transversale]|uniref:Uncharacterized protein n=1 Tax=Lobosporangium transversale TaxID=64571 RepID=A0A1Y2GXC0_9FUNG|nr:hypothetical protein BCR41DRAFT_347074 [Lobosporangium transversale]ORZ26927.1 hypothetical protein BCR41DRAFT_347074 [Lobosporangium transversale]|eukprot:XP_021884674.1 hypothetical protein BCR41DRAFT_347074 [Lobosporangium transversale]